MKKNIIIEDLYSNKKVKEFCVNNKLSDEEVLKNFLPISIYKDVMDICIDCNGKRCDSQTENMTASLVLENGKVKVNYLECEKANRLSPRNFEAMYYTESDEEVYKNENRSKIFTLMNNYIENYDCNKYNKGLYIYGSLGTGKSFMAYQFAQLLTSKGIKVLFVYYPDLVRQIKSLIGSSEMEKLINKLKTVEVLFLDDLGAENNTAFIRDDILSPILQYRMNNELSLFVTSNCSFEVLLEHFSETNNVSDKNKASRIIDRIRFLTTPIELKDKNYRTGK